MEKAWRRNEARRGTAGATRGASARAPRQGAGPPKVVGGSTITQQLAKNLFLSGERTLLRKGQEFVITCVLETLLSKQRILEIYLNNVEWGEGVFGAEAAAQHYFRKPRRATRRACEAARLAVMLPQPKRFEKTPGLRLPRRRAAPSSPACATPNCPDGAGRMRILGIDPGLQTTGFGVIDARAHACITWPAAPSRTTHLDRGDLPARLKVLYEGIAKSARATSRAAAVEIVFVNVNPQATLLLGQARGACAHRAGACELRGGGIHRPADETGRGRHGKAAQGAGAGDGQAPAAAAGAAGQGRGRCAGPGDHARACRALAMARLGHGRARWRARPSGMYRQGRTR